MKIFWSWQSDTHQDSARHFVRDVLGNLIDEINGFDGADDAERPVDDGVDAPISVDHDTLNVGGSPKIAETILRKIRECAVFVADVTPIAKTNGGKLTPNPNVMMELGYALHVLGNERIVLVMNAAEGAELKKLPFDLKHWRAPIVYSLRKGDDEDRREAVAAELKTTLKTRILPGLKLAEGAMREDRRRTHRQPEFSVKIDSDDQGALPITQVLREDILGPSLDDIRRQTPKLATSSARAFSHVGSLAGIRGLGLSGIGKPRPVSEWTADEVATHNQLIDQYYVEYGTYLKAIRNWCLLVQRTFEVNLVLENVGTATGTSIDVDIHFPAGVILYNEGDFPKKPLAPKPPEERPMTAGIAYARAVSPHFDMPRFTHHNVPTTRIDPAERRVSFSTTQLKHHCTAALDSFVVSFATADDIGSFNADYVVTANEPIDPIEGRLQFDIERPADGPAERS
jgi:hypothetical protein